MKKALHTSAFAVSLALVAPFARAGGFEVPDNGTEALGRGGAFTAKADDATALQYNVAGFARQRGTRLLLNANLTLDDYSFQRAGVFPDNARDPRTPWGGSFFPKVTNQGGPFFAPFVGASTDFGYFDRFTVAAGVFGPSGVGNRTYPLGVQGAPSAARYDVVQARTIVAFPTVAAAYRVTDELDVGIGVHAVVASFDLINVSSTDISQALCPNAEYVGCDSQTHVQTSAFTWAGSVGAMFRPAPWLAMGLNVRSPISIDSTGTASATAPAVTPTTVAPSPAEFHTKLPLVVRGGARFIAMDGAVERADVEVNATYEGWKDAQGDGSRVDIAQLNVFKDIHTTVQHGYGDTYSVRVGGQYNFDALGGVLSVRAGAYYDATATNGAFTRMDFNTLDKYAGTLGLGYHVGGFRFNVAYAEIFSPQRVVADGQLRPINGAQHGASLDYNNQLLPSVNNGIYEGHMRIISFGMQVVFDEAFGSTRYAEVTAAQSGDAHARPAPKATGDDTKKKDDGEGSESTSDAKPQSKRETKTTRTTEKADATSADASSDDAPKSEAPKPAKPKPRKKSDWND